MTILAFFAYSHKTTNDALLFVPLTFSNTCRDIIIIILGAFTMENSHFFSIVDEFNGLDGRGEALSSSGFAFNNHCPLNFHVVLNYDDQNFSRPQSSVSVRLFKKGTNESKHNNNKNNRRTPRIS